MARDRAENTRATSILGHQHDSSQSVMCHTVESYINSARTTAAALACSSPSNLMCCTSHNSMVSQQYNQPDDTSPDKKRIARARVARSCCQYMDHTVA